MNKGKTRTITLTRQIALDKGPDGQLIYKYKIVQVTDSIAYHVNGFIDEKTADDLCQHPDWKVTVK